MRSATYWTPYEISVLKANWNNLTAREIAPMVNKTRNAVIGKAHRLKLLHKELQKTEDVPEADIISLPIPEKKKRVRKYKPVPPPEKKKRVRKYKPVPPKPIVEATPIDNRIPIGLMELRTNTCRAPVGYDRNGLATYCGCKTFPGKPFCPEHCQLFYIEKVA
jgi:GcrA cell cycle regulator